MAIMLDTSGQLSKGNMAAMLISGQLSYMVAIPPGLTFQQVKDWLAENKFTNEYWALCGIYSYE